jgi:hypothetical protein
MKTIKRSTRRRDGSALFTVMMVILVMSALVGVVYKASIQRVFSAHKLADRVRALAIAEAGAHQAYAILKTDFAARDSDDAFPETSYGGGTYDVTVTPVSNTVAIVSSVGVYKSVSEHVILDVKNYGDSGSAPIDLSALDYAILCGGDATLRGCGIIAGTNGASLLHANGIFDVRGDVTADINVSSSTRISSGNVTIDGSTWAPSYSLHHKTTITGTKHTSPVALVEIPDVDLTPYYTWALAHGEVKSSFSSSSDYTPNGGILWVNGDVQWSSHATVQGTIIATGDIHISGQVEVAAGPTGMAIVSRDGDIQNTSSGQIDGLIYCRTGDYRQTANGLHTGQLIVKGDIDKGGNSDILTFSRTVLTPPDGGSDPTELIGVSAWQK